VFGTGLYWCMVRRLSARKILTSMSGILSFHFKNSFLLLLRTGIRIVTFLISYSYDVIKGVLVHIPQFVCTSLRVDPCSTAWRKYSGDLQSITSNTTRFKHILTYMQFPNDPLKARVKWNGIIKPPMYKIIYIHVIRCIINMPFSFFLCLSEQW